MDLSSLAVVGLSALFVIFFIIKGNEQARPWRELQAAHDAYQKARSELDAHPLGAAHRQRAAELERAYLTLLHQQHAGRAMSEPAPKPHRDEMAPSTATLPTTAATLS